MYNYIPTIHTTCITVFHNTYYMYNCIPHDTYYMYKCILIITQPKLTSYTDVRQDAKSGKVRPALCNACDGLISAGGKLTVTQYDMYNCIPHNTYDMYNCIPTIHTKCITVSPQYILDV